MITFRKQTEQANSLETVGTVASLVGANGSVQLSSVRNFKDTEYHEKIKAGLPATSKRVSLRLTKENGDYQFVNCSRPVSAALRAKELPLSEVATLPVLKLPQFDDEGLPVMVINEETGVEEPLVLYSISFTGGVDMSATAITITEEDIARKSKVVTTTDFSQLIAL